MLTAGGLGVDVVFGAFAAGFLYAQHQGWRTAYLHNGDMEWGGQKDMLDGVGYDTVDVAACTAP